jgi:CPA2 family monovalent cation:H+ antiporter-2
VVGLLTVPGILRYISKFRSNEMLLIATLGLCFGVSLITLKLGYSVALGAFLIGAIIAEAREVGKIELLIESIRDMFSAVFFVSIGLLIDPRLLVQYWLPIVVITAVVIVGKVISCGAGTFLAGHDTRTSLRVGMAVSQIGEFSFIIAQLGVTLGVTSDFVYPIAVTVSGVTTLSTPYLIKASDPLVGAFDRVAPAALTGFLQSYSVWVSGIGSREGVNSQVRRLLRKWILQVGLNLALITGLFIMGAWLGRISAAWFPNLPRWTGGAKTIVWPAVVLLAMPILIATFRKIRAVANVLAEMSIQRGETKQQTDAQRKVMANTILLAACTAIVLWIMLLSSAILPPWPVLLLLAVVMVGVAIAAWQWMIRIYAKAQIALTETLTTEHPPHSPEPPAMLKSATLKSVVLPEMSLAGGKLIRELELRSKTGASVVGIERGGTQIVNPGPDEELLAHDSVLLIGTEKQIDDAEKLLMWNGAAT